MANLMTGSSGYATGQIDTATTQINNDPVPIRGEASANKINGVATAIVQIEGVLGVGPDLKGSKVDLVERLSVALNANGTIKATTTSAFSSAIAPELGGVPTGTTLPYAGSSAPNGYLLCDGTAISRTTYATLFGVVGSTYGAGDGLTTFNVPDLRGRVVIMQDGAANRITSASTNGSNADTLGGVGGAETHTLTTAQVPPHSHPQAVEPAGTTYQYGSGGAFFDSVDTNTVGGGGAHSNTQPWMALNYIIRT